MALDLVRFFVAHFEFDRDPAFRWHHIDSLFSTGRRLRYGFPPSEPGEESFVSLALAILRYWVWQYGFEKDDGTADIRQH